MYLAAAFEIYINMEKKCLCDYLYYMSHIHVIYNMIIYMISSYKSELSKKIHQPTASVEDLGLTPSHLTRDSSQPWVIHLLN